MRTYYDFLALALGPKTECAACKKKTEELFEGVYWIEVDPERYFCVDGRAEVDGWFCAECYLPQAQVAGEA
jgi:hypothetical protein